MDKIKILIIAVILVIAGAGVYYYYTVHKSSINEFLLDENEDLEIKGKIELEATFANGETKSLTEEDFQSLSVKYDGAEVQTVNWRLKVLANTPQGGEAWPSVKITVAPTRESSYTGSVTENMVLDATCYEDSNILTSPFIWSQSYETQMDGTHTFTITPDSGSYTTIFSKTIDLNTIFTTSDPAGDYFLNFMVDGYTSYQGQGGQTGSDGPWVDISMQDQLLGAGFWLDYSKNQVSIDFDSDVSFY